MIVVQNVVRPTCVNKEKEMDIGKDMIIDALSGILVGGVVFVVLMNAGELISRLVLSLI